jgi:pimeloyl-ACP methyl ester carboxylesterase
MPQISPASYRAGEGEPLVLVHGFTASWPCWRPVLPELVARFDVFAPTLHGHDGGPPPPDGAAHSVTEAGNHFERLLDENGIDTAHFAGNSMGGAISLEMAKRGRARSVVALSPGGGWEEHDTTEPERIIKWFALQRKMGMRTDRYLPWIMKSPVRRRLTLRDVMTRGDQVVAAEAVALARASLRCTVIDDVFATIKGGEARIVDLDRISVPVLVAWGEKDRILPLEKHAGRFRREIPGVEFRVLPGVGHTPMWDDPQGIANLIADFAAAHARRPETATLAAGERDVQDPDVLSATAP